MVFDMPDIRAPFSKRYTQMIQTLTDVNPNLRVVPHDVCSGLEHMQTELTRIEKVGGEGILSNKLTYRSDAP